MKKKMVLIFALVLCCLTGCGNSKDASKNSNDNTPPKIKMDDIKWTVKSGIIEGERYAVFSYKNNTDYTIGDLQLTFTRKESVTDDDMIQKFKYYKDNDYYSNDEIKKFYMTGLNHRFIKPGKSSNKIPCVINNTSWLVMDLEQYKLMEPDKASIVVIKNKKAYLFYYDFKNKEMTMDEDNSGKKIYKWSTSDLAKKLVKPNFESVSVNSDDDGYFSFTSYGVTKDRYKSYLAKIKKKYPKSDSTSDDYYNGYDSKNNEISLSYNSYQQEVTCSLTLDESTEATTAETTSTTETTTTATTAKKKEVKTSGIRPRVKKAIDSYEKVMDSYCKFMKKYNESDDTSSMVKEYANYMDKYSDAVDKFEKIKDDDLNDAELRYYTKVQVRVTKKLADVQ